MSLQLTGQYIETLTEPSVLTAPAHREGRRPRGQRDWGYVWAWVAGTLTFLLAVGPAVIWPGDVPWSCDEPLLIINAYTATAEHHLVIHGLSGSFAVPYGPLPTEFYQLLLLVSHDLRVMAVIRAGLSAAVFALSLVWLARTLRLTPWLAIAFVLSPALRHQHRFIWDCNFLIPVAMLGVAAYASFLRTHSRRAFVTAMTALTIAPLIHLQALPLFAAFVGHALWRHRGAFRRSRTGLLIAGGILLYLNLAYICWAGATLGIGLIDIVRYGHGDKNAVRSLIGPFFGGRLLTGIEYGRRFDQPPPLAKAASEISSYANCLVWFGMAVAAYFLFDHWRRNRGQVVRKESKIPGNLEQTRREVSALAFSCLALQWVMFAALRIPSAPHYFFATLPAFILFAWIGVDFLQRIWLGFPVTAALGLSLGYLTFVGIWRIHTGDRDWTTPSLENQMEVAKVLNRYSDQTVFCEVGTVETFPFALRALRMLDREDGLPSRKLDPIPKPSPYGLLLRYKPDFGNRNSRIELVELQKTDKIPGNAHPVDTSVHIHPAVLTP